MTEYALKYLIRKYSIPVVRGENWSDKRYRKAVTTRANALARYRRELAALLKFGRPSLGLVRSSAEANEILADYDFSPLPRAEIARLGGVVRSEAKTKACRKNSKLGGQPRKYATASDRQRAYIKRKRSRQTDD